MKEPFVFPTERPGVVLRELATAADDVTYFEAYNASRTEINAWDPDAGNKHQTLADTREARESAGDKLRLGIWDGKEFVGSINATPDEDGIEIGYWVDSRKTGVGYATIATRALSGYLALDSRLHANVVEGNRASARVLEKAGFLLAGGVDGKLEFERKKAPPILFPHLHHLEQSVPPGEYKLLDGNDDPAEIREGQIFIITEGREHERDVLPGVHSRGLYNSESIGSREGKTEQIVSFLYHKRGEDGQLETTERAIILRGLGYGVHPGHTGQEPTWYLIGPQLGTIDHETDQIISMPEEDMTIPAKHFSLACMVDGPFGEPVLANPA